MATDDDGVLRFARKNTDDVGKIGMLQRLKFSLAADGGEHFDQSLLSIFVLERGRSEALQDGILLDLMKADLRRSGRE